jgi:hypothetical protein
MAYVKKGGNGGRRPGAGAKKGSKWSITLEKEAARQIFVEEMRPYWRDIVRAQAESAKGHWLIDKSDQDGRAVCDVKPSVEAGKYLSEQMMGKLKEEVDVTSGGEKLAAPIIQYIQPLDNDTQD